MPVRTSKTATGRITLVQEQRFRLMTDDGQNYLLTLAHNAPITTLGLCRLEAEQARVRVEYAGEPGLASAVAHTVERAADG